jgi:hypothetical protein
MEPAPVIETMRTAARALVVGDARERCRSIQAAQDALDAAKAVALAEIEATKAYEIDGASTLTAWVSNELHVNARPAGVLVANAMALRDLPLVGESALAGRMSAEHVKVFVYGIRHVGLEHLLDLQEAFVEVAENHSPAELFEAVRHLKDRVHPEELDESWRDGMDKEDVTVSAVPDGWHVSGFLNTLTGAKLKKVIDAVSAPRDVDDDRTASQRRVQGLDDLLSAVLANGLPSDKGVKPHMSVFVDADTLRAAAERVRQESEQPFSRPDPMPDVEPATLAGHGHIGPHLLMYLACISDFTAFLVDHAGEQAQILNAGRARYQPTALPRRAVLARQKGVCATPGCNHSHLEIHHTVFWGEGGATDLDLLIGLCVRYHHTLHRGDLVITGTAATGFEFTNRAGRPLRRRRTGYPRAV